jgi:ectoine hydroxylase-related dioxygenase (phytanoyl-CoA dioxygenase family)
MSERQIDRDRFLEEGYLVVHGVIPPGDLDAVREAYERLVDVQRGIWAETRAAGDPPGGMWETHRQPRLHLSRRPLSHRIDRSTARAVEMWLSEGAHGVSSALLDLPDASVTEMMMMCNPVRDHGPAHWHRDLYPPFGAPVQGYVEDIIENGPRYVQWNLSLYDDDVLWVIPGSHARLNTAQEDEMLGTNSRVPFPNGVQTHLSAGDGVVYILPILHWGSNYSTKLRRTIHGGFSTYTQYENTDYLKHLSASAQATFERWIQRSEQMMGHTVSTLRGAIQKDPAAYYAGLEKLHPGRGEKGLMLSTVYLSKVANRVYALKHLDLDRPEHIGIRYAAMMSHSITLQWGASIADFFSQAEAKALWERFKPVDARVQSDVERPAPGYEQRPSRYHFNEMPKDFGIADFIESWNT